MLRCVNTYTQLLSCFLNSTVANSNAMNGWSSADRLKVITPWWKTALYALDTVLAVLTVLCIWRLVVAIKRKKTWTAEQAANTASAQNQQ